jgi:hypothetical protein
MTSSDRVGLREPVALAAHPGAASQALVDYFRCPIEFAALDTAEGLSAEEGYFRFGEAVGFGRLCSGKPSSSLGERLEDAVDTVTCSAGRTCLPFDLSAVITNLRQERYSQRTGGYVDRMTSNASVNRLYYFFRPVLPVAVRRHLQRIRLFGWQQIPFPRWPVDTSVESLMQQTMAILLRNSGDREIPFVWFWPEGASSCAVMTHDVEGRAGRQFSRTLMDLDDSFHIKSAFQIVPGLRRDASDGLVQELRNRGFEVNLHDLNHDGSLFRSETEFLARVPQINRFTRELGCRGFRSAAMYREQRWFDAFECSFDMSVPNVAHLEPQRGGCCTVMPYFVGKILELPLTTIQDYSLFHVLGDYSTALWKKQIGLIRAKNGLITFITHPDYLVEARAQRVYLDLLAHLSELRDEGHVWMALPGEVDSWWRNRAQMMLVPHGHSWRIEGPGSDRARLAHATYDGGRVVYTVDRLA